MLSELIQKERLYSLLYQIDQDLAEEQKHKRCPYCQGPLHQGNYERKPRGGPVDLDEKFNKRRSWCCGRQGCRRRTMPPSVLFMGRRVYWGCVLLILTALRQNRVTGFSSQRLRKRFGVAGKTLKRWKGYFREAFPKSAVWQRLRGRLSVEVSNGHLPGDLLDCFLEDQPTEERLAACLLFLARGFDLAF